MQLKPVAYAALRHRVRLLPKGYRSLIHTNCAVNQYCVGRAGCRRHSAHRFSRSLRPGRSPEIGFSLSRAHVSPILAGLLCPTIATVRLLLNGFRANSHLRLIAVRGYDHASQSLPAAKLPVPRVSNSGHRHCMNLGVHWRASKGGESESRVMYEELSPSWRCDLYLSSLVFLREFFFSVEYLFLDSPLESRYFPLTRSYAADQENPDSLIFVSPGCVEKPSISSSRPSLRSFRAPPPLHIASGT